MTGVKISELPLETVLNDTDEILITRGNSSKRATIASLVRTDDISFWTNQIATLSTNTINVFDSSSIDLTYNSYTRTLSADISVVPVSKGGTGQTNFLENGVLVGDNAGTLEQRQLSGGPGIAFERVDTPTDKYFLFTNTARHSATNLSNSATAGTVTIQSSTGTNTTVQGANQFTAGVMTAQDKQRTDSLWTNLSGVTEQDILPLLPVPKVSLTVGSTVVEYLTAGNAPASDKITLQHFPIIVTSDITAEMLTSYQIFVEMVIFKKSKKGYRYTTPIASDTKPWGGAFWTRGGSLELSATRFNHIPVTQINKTINLAPCLSNHFKLKQVLYKEAATGSLVENLELIVPSSSKKSKTVSGNINPRYGYARNYKPLYVAFRYIAWLPKNNNGRGQIVSGPLSPTIRIANSRFPFTPNAYKSTVYGYPVVNYTPITKTNFVCKII